MVAALSELAGVDEDIEVFLDRDAFTLDYDPALVNLEDMYTAIRGLGYEPRLSAGEEVESAIAEAGAAVPEPVATALATAKTEGKLVFRGRMDGSSPGNDVPVTGADLRAALAMYRSVQSKRWEKVWEERCANKSVRKGENEF